MSIIRQLMQGLTATGRHRAVDRIPVLEGERDAWEAKFTATQAKLNHADALITKVCSEKNALRFETARLAAELETVTEGHVLLEAETDELAARLTGAQQEIANLRAVSSPAPANCGPAIPLPDDTVETNVGTLWNARGLRTVA